MTSSRTFIDHMIISLGKILFLRDLLLYCYGEIDKKNFNYHCKKNKFLCMINVNCLVVTNADYADIVIVNAQLL